MLENVKVLCHSSIKFEGEKIIYFDPFKIDKKYRDADIIFITHSHYDHFSEEDILKVRNENTIIVIPSELYINCFNLGVDAENIVIVDPEENFVIDNIEFETIPAYNTNKDFHPRKKDWVGYIIHLDGITYYIAGDTDITDENKKVKCDVAFVPIGGTYTMNAKEAATLVNIIKPKIAVPIHYNCIVGTKEDEKVFTNTLSKDIQLKILL